MTEMVEGVSVGVIKVDPEKYLKVEVLEVDFVDSFKTANAKKEVVAPHWPCGKYKFNYSEKPAVMKFGKAVKASIKVKVDSKGVSGDGILKGNIKGYLFEGKLPLSSGEKTVSVTLKKAPDDVQWLKGSMIWGVEGGGLSVSAGSTFAELFFVFDDPEKMKFFSKIGVWAEALRFLFEKGSVRRVKDAGECVEQVTKCCFDIAYHKYEIDRGAPKFGGWSKSFELSAYMRPKYENVNCYDQTYAVVVFSGALGLDVNGLFIKPFGFLNLTNLVGRGNCNNPFPGRKYQSELRRLGSTATGKVKLKLSPPKVDDYLVVGSDDPDRSAFGNHMFCEYKNKIFDACAGPSIGNGDRDDYVKNSIDSTTSLNSMYRGLPGLVSDISEYKKILDTRGFVDKSVEKVK